MLMKKTEKKMGKTVVYFLLSSILIISSLLLLRWHVNEQSYRARIKQNGVKIRALVISRSQVQYPTSEGIVKITPIVSPSQGTLKRFSEVTVYYDKSNVRNAVLDQDDGAFNITIFVVCLKLFVVGVLLLYFGLNRTRKYSNKVKS